MSELTAPRPHFVRNVSLYEGICRAFLGRWEVLGPIGQQGKLRDGTQLSKIELQRLKEITCEQIPQHAFEGRLPVWGRETGRSGRPFKFISLIPYEFWASGGNIEFGSIKIGDWKSLHARSVLRFRDCSSSYIANSSYSSMHGVVWSELFTSSSAVEEIWPFNAEDYESIAVDEVSELLKMNPKLSKGQVLNQSHSARSVSGRASKIASGLTLAHVRALLRKPRGALSGSCNPPCPATILLHLVNFAGEKIDAATRHSCRLFIAWILIHLSTRVLTQGSARCSPLPLLGSARPTST